MICRRLKGGEDWLRTTAMRRLSASNQQVALASSLACPLLFHRMAPRRRSTAPRGRGGSSDEGQRDRRRSQWSPSAEKKTTPTFFLWIGACVMLCLSAAIHFANTTKPKPAVVPVLKHDQAACADECWVSGSRKTTLVVRCTAEACVTEYD